jgi:hypothetical protein
MLGNSNVAPAAADPVTNTRRLILFGICGPFTVIATEATFTGGLQTIRSVAEFSKLARATLYHDGRLAAALTSRMH